MTGGEGLLFERTRWGCLQGLAVEQLARLMGQSLRTGRWSPYTPHLVHVDTKLCVCERYSQSGERVDVCVSV